MEKAEIESSKPLETPPFSFTRRRSHLKSETYYTLVRILSHCYDKSQCSLADQVVPQEQNPGTTLIESLIPMLFLFFFLLVLEM